MLLEELRTQNSDDIKSSLIDSSSKLEEFQEKTLDQIDDFKKLVQALEDYQVQLGTSADTQILRIQMKDDIAHGNRAIMKITELLQSFNSENLSNTEDHDYRNKISKRAQVNFELYRERYTKALREIHKKEKLTKPQKLKLIKTSIGNIFNNKNEVLGYRGKGKCETLSHYKPIVELEPSHPGNHILEVDNETDSGDKEQDEEIGGQKLLKCSPEKDQKAMELGSKSKTVIVIGTLVLFGVVALLLIIQKYPFERI